MLKRWMAVLLGAVACFASAQTFDVRVDPRVEAAAIVGYLAGDAEFQQAVPTYRDAVEAHFAAYRTHEAVRQWKRWRWWKPHLTHFMLGAVVPAVVAKEGFGFEPALDLGPDPVPGIPLWSGHPLRLRLKALRAFVADSGFEAFFASQKAFYAGIEAEHRQVLRSALEPSWWVARMGAGPTDRFLACPSPMWGHGGGFGMGAAGGQRLAVLGVGRKGGCVASPALLVHEWLHAVVNPWVQAYWSEWRGAAGRLRAPVRDVLWPQGYGILKSTFVSESVVRTLVGRYLEEHATPEAVERQLREEAEEGFLAPRPLLAALRQAVPPAEPGLLLERGRSGLVACWQGLAATASRDVEAWKVEEGARWDRFVRDLPRIVAVTPGEGASLSGAGDFVVQLTLDRPLPPHVVPALFDCEGCRAKAGWAIAADRSGCQVSLLRSSTGPVSLRVGFLPEGASNGKELAVRGALRRLSWAGSEATEATPAGRLQGR